MNKILYFSAPWCGPCKMLGPKMDELAETIPVEKINIDGEEELCERFEVRAVPTILIVDESGKVLNRIIGVKPVKEIKAIYESFKSE